MSIESKTFTENAVVLLRGRSVQCYCKAARAARRQHPPSVNSVREACWRTVWVPELRENMKQSNKVDVQI